jgi:radical SAM protein (TIGR01212 family)
MLEERFYSLGRYLKNTFDERIHRINVEVPPGDAPGPYWLCAGGSLDARHEEGGAMSVVEQVALAKARVRQRFKLGKFVVGVHSGPSTPVSLAAVGAAVEELLKDNEVIGLSFTILPNSLAPEMVKFLKNASKYVATWLEPGLHTIHDETLARIGLSHKYSQAKEALRPFAFSTVHVAPHVVFGLPGETPEMMRETMAEISRLCFGGVNIHNFYVARNAPFEVEYAEGKIKLLEREEYVGLVCDFIELLPSDAVLHGIVDSVAEDRLVAPAWMSLRKENTDLIIAELEKRGAMQGCKLNPLRELVISTTPAHAELRSNE